MKSLLTFALASLIIFICPDHLMAQAPDLGASSSFAMFTSAGAFNNDGTTMVTGDIGTNVGAFAGFPPGIVIGEIHVADPITAMAATDLDLAYAELVALTCGEVIGTTLGNGQVLTPNIYCLGGASVLNGDLVLDGECDTDAFFIFQIDGALSTAVLSSVTLINGASLCNVYWQINGAVSIGEDSDFRGTILAAGAITLLEGASLTGRGLTTAGAIEMHNNIVSLEMPPVASILTADGPTTFCLGDSVILSGNCGGIWSNGATTESITVTQNGDYFVTNTNGCGVTTSNHFIITVNSLPDCTISGVFVLCGEQSVELCVSAGFSSYVWSTGATTNCITVDLAGSYMVTVTDADGCTNVCSQDVTDSDALPPTIICPAHITIECDVVPLPVNTGTATAEDDCETAPAVSYTDVIEDGLCAQSSTITRTWIATDVAGNTATCNQIISIEDSTSPAITCPIVISPVECGDTPSFGMATATDACDSEVTITFTTDSVPGLCAQAYTLTRTWTATDACGHTATCSASISIVDTTPPSLSCPPDMIATCGISTDPAMTGTATGADFCDASPAITYTDVLTQGICPMILTRTWTATDACGNMATCIQIIEVTDNTPPEITCGTIPSSIECTDAPNLGTPTVIDDCDPDVIITFITDSIPGICVGEYTLIRTWIATDDCGNSSSCSATIEVQDNTAPVITCPIVASPIDCGLTPAFGAATAIDGCDGEVAVVFTDVTVQGLCEEEYSVTRTWVATDDCGNTSSCNATIEVQDNTAPVITCPIVVSPIECGLNPSFGVATAIDACDGQVVVVFTDVTVQGFCAQEYSVTRTWIATDECGNSSSCSATIEVQDNTAPVITCPIVVSPIECGLTPSFGAATAIDACDADVTIGFSDVIIPGLCISEYTVTRTWIAADDCGNTSSCSRTIVVGGNSGMFIICPLPVTVQCAEDLPVVDLTLVQAEGGCGLITITHLGDLVTNQVCTNNFILMRTYQATDLCGNTLTCNQVITVLDNTPPAITFVNPEESQNGDTIRTQCYGQDPLWDIPEFGEDLMNATDVCGGEVTITYTSTFHSEGDCTTDGFINLYRLAWTATDICGNSSSAFLFLALVDTIAPVIVGVPADLTVNCDEIPLPITLYATDECLCACVVSFEETNISMGACQDGLVIIRTWTARDRCGNETIDTQRITLIDQTGPVLEFMHSELTNISNDSIIGYTCTEGGIPAFYNSLDKYAVSVAATCGDSVNVIFKVDVREEDNCDFFGYIEQRIYQWIGTDACGNSTLMTITVRLIDDEAPVISGVPEMACIGDPILNDIEASDNCDHAMLRYWDVQIPNPCGEGMAMRRTFEAFDACGNMVRDTAILLPDFIQVPVINFVLDQLVHLDSSVVKEVDCAASGTHYTSFGIEDVNVTGTCSENFTIAFSEQILSTGDCMAGEAVARVELKWVATDVCGNSAEKTLIVDLVDNSSPFFVNFLPVIFVGCHDSIPDMTVSDNCGEVSMNATDVKSEGPCIYQYDIFRSITATDQCGNTSIREQIIHVGRNGGPVFTGIMEEVCDDLTIPIVTAYDACAGQFVDVTMLQDTLDMLCRDGLVIQRTWTATDICGRTTVTHQTIIMHDQTPPEIVIPVNSVLLQFIDDAHILVYQSETRLLAKLNALDAESVQVQDDCDQIITPILTIDTLVALDCKAAGYKERRIYTWTATDICDNSASITVTIDIMDDLPPVFSVLQPDTIIICSPMPPAPLIVLLDTLEVVSIVYTETVTSGNEAGQFTYSRIWTATDACGNVSTSTQQIIWQPGSSMACEIILPETVECNSHGVLVGSSILDGDGPYIYEWSIEGEKCFIQTGQGTPAIGIYIGWTEVKVILTVTDTNGCVSMCMAFLDCVEEVDLPFSESSPAHMVMTEIGHKMGYTDVGNSEESSIDLTQLTLWPNPAGNSLNISFESGIAGQVTYSLTNDLGQRMIKENLIIHKGSNGQQFDVSMLPNGLYLFRIVADNQSWTKRMVIMRNQ